MNPYTYYPILKIMVIARKLKRVAFNSLAVIGYVLVWVLGLHNITAFNFKVRRPVRRVSRSPIRMPYANDIF